MSTSLEGVLCAHTKRPLPVIGTVMNYPPLSPMGGDWPACLLIARTIRMIIKGNRNAAGLQSPMTSGMVVNHTKPRVRPALPFLTLILLATTASACFAATPADLKRPGTPERPLAFSAVSGATAPSLPLISNIQTLTVGGNSQIINWTTDQPSTSQVNYGPSPGYGFSSPLDGSLVTNHSVTLPNLVANNSYNFGVLSTNAGAGTAASGNSMFTVTPNVGYVAIWGIDNTSAIVTWSTDLPANTAVAYGTTPALGQSSAVTPALTNDHGTILVNLTATTTYYIRALSTDGNGNTGGSTILSFTTTGYLSVPPPVISNVQATSITQTSAIITWTTDILSNSQVNYGTTTAYGSTVLNWPKILQHSVVLTGLTPGTLYNYTVLSQDPTGTGLGTTGNFTFTTPLNISIPPTISNLATSSITTTSATITWNTDQPSSTRVNYGPTTAYGSFQVDANLVTSHSVTLTGLTAGTGYNFNVVSANSSGGSVTSANGTFSTLTVVSTPPFVGYVAAWGINNSGATVTWSTDVPANTQLAYGTSPALGQLSPVQTALTASHGVTLTGLNSGTTYYFVSQSTGASGATGYSSTMTFTTSGAVSTPPVISNVKVGSITNNSAVVTWSTDQPASSKVNYGLTTAYNLSTPLDSTLVTSHTATLNGLTPATTYNLNVVSANGTGNSATSVNYSLQTTGTAPVAPVISAINTTNVTSSTATITWTTDQPSSSLVNYGTTTAYGLSSPNPALVTSHSVTLTNLLPNTTYNFDVVSANSSALSVTSVNGTFKTLGVSGTPPVLSFVAFWGITSSGVTISWSTNVAATTQVAFGTQPSSLTQLSPLQPALTPNHGVILTNLNGGTTYYFVAQSTDGSGVTGTSTMYSFTTVANSGPTISSVVVTPASGNTGAVGWTTSVPSFSFVQYGSAAGNYVSYSGTSPLTVSPRITLGYVPSGLIHFQLVSMDSLGNRTVSADMTFIEP